MRKLSVKINHNRQNDNRINQKNRSLVLEQTKGGASVFQITKLEYPVNQDDWLLPFQVRNGQKLGILVNQYKGAYKYCGRKIR